ncbi:MAG: tail fiber domain-containing protein [Candidatus Omnitrophota bacterium]
MKKNIFTLTLVLVCLLGGLDIRGDEPVAVSPGSEAEAIIVWQNCPTFSWSAVNRAAAYRLAIFKVNDAQVTPYEEIAAKISPVVTIDIPGRALSWTLSSDKSLEAGGMYTWFVMAMDSNGNSIGQWSKGRLFRVEEAVGLEQKLGEKLKEYGVSEEVISKAMEDVKSEVKEGIGSHSGSQPPAPNSPDTGIVKGSEYNSNTFYGRYAGAHNTTGACNTFIGATAGYWNTTGNYNSFLGDASGYSNTTASANSFFGYAAGYLNTTGMHNTFLGHWAGYYNTIGNRNSFLGNYAGCVNSTGSDNTYLGYVAGFYNTSGSWNTFLGNYAGHSNTTGDLNLFLGYNAGSRNTTGKENLFLGNYAGYSNTTPYWNMFIGNYAGYSNTGGDWNIFHGYKAGYQNTTGKENLFLGHYAGYSNQTYYWNIFIGNYAGYSTTAGDWNIFLGYKAGYGNISGANNMFLGNYSGLSNTTGSWNIFLGNDSGNANTTGEFNTFLGYKAGYSNTTGANNMFMGYYTGYSNTTGSWNTFLGNDAGNANTTGEFNIYLGYKAGYQNTMGQGNMFLGYQSGYNNTGGSKNIFLGYTAGFNESGSNKLYIANSDTFSPLIYGEFDNAILTVNGSLGVGTNPAYPLHMASGAYCSAGGVWTNASSRSLKENIRELSSVEALDALKKLNPVRFNYKVDKSDQHVGFIAEDVPALLATADRKGLSPMDITAVLTKVVQAQQQTIADQQQEYKKTISNLENRIADLMKRLERIENN